MKEKQEREKKRTGSKQKEIVNKKEKRYAGRIEIEKKERNKQEGRRKEENA